MSQAMLLRINALEGRVKSLEERLAVLEPPLEGNPYRIAHRGFGHWFVETPDGTKVNDQGLTKEEAEAMALDLNERLGELSA